MHIRNDLACSEDAQSKRCLFLSHADRNFLFDFENRQRLYLQIAAPTVLRPFSSGAPPTVCDPRKKPVVAGMLQRRQFYELWETICSAESGALARARRQALSGNVRRHRVDANGFRIAHRVPMTRGAENVSCVRSQSSAG